MNRNKNLTVLKKEINNSELSSLSCEFLFGGANLIISDDPNRQRKDHDVFVLSKDAMALSWLVYQLKDIFNEDIDYMNKYLFYPSIGGLFNEAISKQLNVREQMHFVIDNLHTFWEVDSTYHWN